MCKKIFSIVVLACGILLFTACDKKEEQVQTEQVQTEQAQTEQAQVEEPAIIDPDPDHSAENALDWNGVYKGILPCEDCEGVETELELSFDNSYIFKIKYLGQNDDTVYTMTGPLQWVNGGTIRLINESADSIYFQVGENYLEVLDVNGNKIESSHNLILEKVEE